MDEPGLGKTITVLSLILQTAGLSTESSISNAVEDDKGADDKTLFDSYWRESVPPDWRRMDLLKLLNKVGKRVPRGSLPVEVLRKRIDSDAYAMDFDKFEQDVE